MDSVLKTTSVVDVAIVGLLTSLNGVWLMNTHIIEKQGLEVEDAESVIAANAQLTLRKLWIATFAYITGVFSVDKAWIKNVFYYGATSVHTY